MKANNDNNHTNDQPMAAVIKKKMWDTIMNPHLYKVYTKVIDKALHVLPSREFDGHEVFPGLYVGDVWAAYNLEELKKRHITHVVTVVMGLEPPFPHDFKYMSVEVRDVEDETICDHFEEIVKFIDGGRAIGNVFLHCLRGVSRSGTIAAAYVIHQKRVSVEEAIVFLREKRKVIDPNPSFLKQLDNYYKLISTTTSSSSTSATTSPNPSLIPSSTTTTTTTSSSAITNPATTTTEKETITNKAEPPTQTTIVQVVAPETIPPPTFLSTPPTPSSSTPTIEPFKTITSENTETSDYTTTLIIKNQ